MKTFAFPVLTRPWGVMLASSGPVVLTAELRAGTPARAESAAVRLRIFGNFFAMRHPNVRYAFISTIQSSVEFVNVEHAVSRYWCYGRSEGRERGIAPAALGRGPDQIPIRGAARGGGDQEMFLEDGPIGYTPRPANLGGVRSANAIYMVGDSMDPRYEPGWLLHVNPFKPPTRGRDVVLYKADDTVLIKQFVGWEGDTLVLRQPNPTDTLRIPRGEVRECHLVVGADQEG
jgi:Peptidase S24-like